MLEMSLNLVWKSLREMEIRFNGDYSGLTTDSVGLRPPLERKLI